MLVSPIGLDQIVDFSASFGQTVCPRHRQQSLQLFPFMIATVIFGVCVADVPSTVAEFMHLCECDGGDDDGIADSGPVRPRDARISSAFFGERERERE